jgi:hypothetical protein
MRTRAFAIVLSLAAGLAPPLAASQTRTAWESAPPGGPETRYCMRIEAITGSRIERIRCWTHAQWEAQGVDLDKDWPREGVRVIA